MAERRHQLADEFEGKDILWYVNHPEELEKLMEGIIDDELTAGRIRTIYVRAKYGTSSVKEIAEYYDIPEDLVRDIANKRIFADIIGKR